jgi:hypothetical protein
MRLTEQPDAEAAAPEHRDIVNAHLALGRRIECLPSVPGSCTRPPAAGRAGSQMAGFQPQPRNRQGKCAEPRHAVQRACRTDHSDFWFKGFT